MKRFTTTMLAALFLVAILTGCSGMGGGGGDGKKNDPTPKALELTPFASCGEMVDEIKALLIAEMEQQLDGSKRWMCRGSVGIDDVGEAPVEASMDGAQATGTNLQEPGVDEADLIKTDGKFAYAIVGGEIRVVRVWPFTDFRRVARISPEGTPKGMYLRGNRLAVISVKEAVWSDEGGIPQSATSDGYMPTIKEPAQVIEQVYDVAAPASPVLKSTRKVTGSLLDSRRIGGTIHVVIRNAIAQPQLDYNLGIPYEQLPECPSSGQAQPTQAMLDRIAAMKEANRAKIEALTMGELIPFAGEVTQSDCVTAYRSRAAAGADLLTVVTGSIDGDAADLSAVTVVGNGGALYASPAALYVASRMNPWNWWATGDEPEDTTVIHRFSLEGALPEYAGSGTVEGHLVDNNYAGSRRSGSFSMAQFAMSEHAGFLRVATTVGGIRGDSSSDSRVSVLDAATPTLEEAGVVAGMGKGEKIHAVRFMGTKAFVVTYKKTDPLYVVDLADPEAPKVAGELKIPGFSTYLHPLDETHVIGLGFFTDDQDGFAWTQGLKLSLFDVSDPANPREVNHREIGSRGSYSPAVEEHHAFTLDAKGRLALPVDIYEGGDGSSGYGTFDFAGVMLLKADLSGTFADLGTIRMVEGGGDDPYGLGYRSTAVLRTVIVGNSTTEGIVTLTAEGVQLNRIDASMTQVGGVL